MKKRFILTGISGMLLGVALTSLGFRVLAPQGVQAQAPQGAPAPDAAKGERAKAGNRRLQPRLAVPTSRANLERTRPRIPVASNCVSIG